MSRPAMRRTSRLTLRLLAMLWLVGMVLLLSACGGGETEEDAQEGRKSPQPPQCQLNPKACA